MNNSQLAMMIKRLKKRCNQRLERTKQLERERDALLEIVRNEADCKVCKHLKEECDGDCSFCEIEGPCACARCTTKDSHWEWAGIKEDNP